MMGYGLYNHPLRRSSSRSRGGIFEVSIPLKAWSASVRVTKGRLNVGRWDSCHVVIMEKSSQINQRVLKKLDELAGLYNFVKGFF